MHKFSTLVILTIYAIGLGAQAASAGSIAHVVTPVAPLYPIIKELMRGSGTPILILQDAQNAHNAQLSVTDVKALAQANVMVVADTTMNKGLYQTLAKVKKSDFHLIALTDLEGADPLTYRHNNPLTDAYAKNPAKSPWLNSVFSGKTKTQAAPHSDHANTVDPHLWLDPVRMANLLPALADRLGEIQPEYAATFQANAERLSTHLREEVTPAIASLFAQAHPAQTKDMIPYITFHDAYQYFDVRFGLSSFGYITQRPEEFVGAASMKALLEASNASQVRCIVTESVDPLARNLAVRSNAFLVVLSPERDYPEKELPSAPWAQSNYDRLLYKIAQTFIDCIEGKKQ